MMMMMLYSSDADKLPSWHRNIHVCIGVQFDASECTDHYLNLQLSVINHYRLHVNNNEID
jgi:hypothetical protein